MRFVLIHGGFHGAWCWERTDRGARAARPRGDRARHARARARGRNEPDSVAGRQATILSALQPGDVLVGRSGGGYDITMAADAAETDIVAHCVLPRGRSPARRAHDPRGDGRRNAEDGRFEADPVGMFRHLQKADNGGMEFVDFDATARHLLPRLRRRHCATGRSTTSRPSTSARSPPSSCPCRGSGPRSSPAATSGACRTTRSPSGSRSWLPRVLGVEPLTIDASHSPFLSQPAELAALVVYATTTEPIGPLNPD